MQPGPRPEFDWVHYFLQIQIWTPEDNLISQRIENYTCPFCPIVNSYICSFLGFQKMFVTGLAG